ncbi:site-specific integrase [Cryobacterium glaciale]|uniref:Site-specific integrase n=1 Tax=Cryobacterium glaciale TaxID=1259145 RepID=A0A4R8V677_9MICO|nr:tyrosine-type recombinase/integrase [Cryobacterium glaciale]TFB76736.1 site-specific integrase [Cryobacterium glaciale]
MTRKDRLNDIFRDDSRTYAHLRAADPELPDHVWEVIIRYRPQLSDLQWDAVREFTIVTAINMKPRTFETVRRMMTMTGRFNAWVWASTGTTLTVERVYTQNNVYRYLQECLPKHSETHRWGVARQLGTIAEVLAENTVTRLPTPHAHRRRPFTIAEVASMHSWAASLTTDLKRQNAQALLGLAGGAGLRANEIIDLRLGDIDIVDGRLFVTVPGMNSRRVPVRHPWNRTLLRSLAGRTDSSEYVFRAYRFEEYRPRAIQTFLTDHPGRVRATLTRLRATWIVAQIDNGLPLPVLMALAGFSTTGSLDKHLVHAQPLDVANYVGLVIGEEVLA